MRLPPPETCWLPPKTRPSRWRPHNEQPWSSAGSHTPSGVRALTAHPDVLTTKSCWTVLVCRLLRAFHVSRACHLASGAVQAWDPSTLMQQQPCQPGT
jgi:hypothetical protein